ncbi:MAG: hypothetical protein ACQGVK_09280 [Myxococcota bacterium]
MTTQAPAGATAGQPPGASGAAGAAGPGPVREGSRRGPSAWLGWVFATAELAYVLFLHHGVGVAPGGFPTRWWHPTQFLLDVEWIARLIDLPLQASLVAALPAALLAAGVFATHRGATARWLALSGVVASLLFGFYGFGPVRIWEFFHWRGSLVMATIAVCLGGVLAAPWLARSWLERHPVLQVLLYLPVLLAVVVLLRHTTGTDERLSFNFSPWPAVTLFGLEIGAYAVVGVLFGLAIGVASLAELRSRPGVAAAGLALGLAWPLGWMLFRFGSLPEGSAAALVVVSAVLIALGGLTREPGRTAALRRRASHLALGGLLAFVPLAAGRALSTGDYTATRFVRAEQIIGALARHYEKRDGYPEDLGELVELGYLERIPRPRVGFDFVYALTGLEPIEFSYQSLGSSYVLEFEFTEWVQCAYNPPWEDEEEDADWGADDGDGEDWEDDELEEAWSCPESRPELW